MYTNMHKTKQIKDKMYLKNHDKNKNVRKRRIKNVKVYVYSVVPYIL